VFERFGKKRGARSFHDEHRALPGHRDYISAWMALSAAIFSSR
jgi:hypothetical protein